MSYKKLLSLYKNSSILPFCREDKIVILSDIHRGDGSYSDSLIGNKNIYLSALNYYYKEGYTLIEAGDGDELWKNKSFIDIAYNHKDIFIFHGHQLDFMNYELSFLSKFLVRHIWKYLEGTGFKAMIIQTLTN